MAFSHYVAARDTGSSRFRTVHCVSSEPRVDVAGLDLTDFMHFERDYAYLGFEVPICVLKNVIVTRQLEISDRNGKIKSIMPRFIQWCVWVSLYSNTPPGTQLKTDLENTQIPSKSGRESAWGFGMMDRDS